MQSFPAFPWLRFGLFVVTSLGISGYLLSQVMPLAYHIEVEQQVEQATNKLKAELDAILATQEGLVTNARLVKGNIRSEAAAQLTAYISQLSVQRAAVSHFMLPRLSESEVGIYELDKQDEGYLTFKVFGNPDSHHNKQSCLFPAESLKPYQMVALKQMGKDLYSYAHFRPAMDRAVQSQSTQVAHSHVTADNAHGFWLFSPVFDTDYLKDVPNEQRMSHVQLMVATEVYLEQLINQVLQQNYWLQQSYTLNIDTSKDATSNRRTVLRGGKAAASFDLFADHVIERQLSLLDQPILLTWSVRTPNKVLTWHYALWVLALLVMLYTWVVYTIQQNRVSRCERQQAKEALQRERDRAESTLTSLGEGVVTTDLQGMVLYANPKACEIFYRDGLPLEGCSLQEIYAPSYADEVDKILTALTITVEEAVIQQLHNLKAINHYGDEVLLDCTLSPIRQSDGSVGGAAMVFEDVTHLEEMRHQIENMAKRDHLTGLFNRYEFEQQLREKISEAHEHRKQHAFCYIDLDQFKVVNDTAGHMAGDQLLRQLSAVLIRHIPENAILGRLGGDEFGLILQYTHQKQALLIAEQLIHAIQQFVFMWQEKRFQVGASIGLALINELSVSIEQVLITADTACYLAKEKGRNRVELAHAENSDVSRRKEELVWAERIPRALAENRLVLYIQYMQPLTGIRAHAEVLVRMLDEEGKLLAPGQFIPAAERYGLMAKVDRWIIEHALNKVALLIEQKQDKGIVFGLNLSGQSLADEKFLLFIHEALTKRPYLAKHLCFEITETAAMSNMAQALACMKLIKDLGATLALDDFGSGLSSFAYLRQMPVDYLKIDGAFVKNIHQDRINRAIVANIHQLAGVFQLKTIAEFVENEAIVDELKRIGVDLAQGYGVHVPEPWV